jgi:hypothetical protein
MKPPVGGGDESNDSNATPKTTSAGPLGRQFREGLAVYVARQRAAAHFVLVGQEIGDPRDPAPDPKVKVATTWVLSSQGSITAANRSWVCSRIG